MNGTSYHIAVDIGGTFTDCVVSSDGQIVAATKSLSTPSEPSQGVVDVLEVAADELGIAPADLLGRTDLFFHGSTVATNAIIERNGPVTALITTKGHEDSFIIGRVNQRIAGLAPSEYVDEYRLRRADPLVPRSRIVGIDERIDVDGCVLAPLDEAAAAEHVHALMRAGATSIAVSFLWSIVNPEHEQRMKALIERLYPGTYVALSSDVAPLIGEYERTVTTVLTAYLGPKIETYLARMSRQLGERGFKGTLLLVQATGGLAPPEGLKVSPLVFLDSGPVAGVLGGRFFAECYGEPNMILMDMGGTSFDAAVVHAGKVQLDEQPVIEKYAYLIPKVDVRSIGAGGGSKIWVDVGNRLTVGPRSAGSDPGPACYALGGSEPTTTDANVALGLLDPNYFLGGRRRLDRQRALDALARVGEPLGMSALEVAGGAFRIINAQMADLIRVVSIERGYDPRTFSILSFGGAGSTHAAFIANDLGIRRVFVPKNAPVFCALGMQTTDLLHSFQKTCVLGLPPPAEQMERFNAVMGELEQRAREQFRDEGVAAGMLTIARFAYVKYVPQVHELVIKLPFERMSAAGATELAAQFEREYEATYGSGTASRGAAIEIRRCRVEARSVLPHATFARPDGDRAWRVPEAPPLKQSREVILPDERGGLAPQMLAVYDGERLSPGNVMHGPCIVERIADTVVIPQFASASVDMNATIRIDVR